MNDTPPTDDAAGSTGDVARLLADGGVTLRLGGEQSFATHDAAGIGKYAPLSDPAGAEQLCAQLASRIRGWEPNIVLVWEDAEDAVLAHIVSRELHITALRMWNADGLVACSGQLPPGSRAVILTDVLRETTPALAMRSFVEQQGGSVVGVATFVKANDLRHEDVVALIESAGSLPDGHHEDR